MSTKSMCTWYFLASGCFWASLISVHGFLVLTAQQHFGLHLSEATFPLIILHLSVALLEIPTGAIADSWSRSKSAIAGQACVAVSLLSIPFIPSLSEGSPYFGVLIFSVLFGLGWSLFSGSLKGLVSSHIRTTQPELMPWFVKKSSLINNLFILSSTVLYPIAYSHSWQSVWFLSSALAICSIGFTVPLLLSESREETGTKRTPIRNIKLAVQSFRLNNNLLWLSLISVILFAFATTFESTLQAHAGIEILSRFGALQFIPLAKIAWLAWFFHTVGSISASHISLLKLGVVSKTPHVASIGMTVATVCLAAYFLILYFGESSNIDAGALIMLSTFLGWLVTIIRNENATELQLEIRDAASTSTVLSIGSLSQDLLASLFLSIFALKIIGTKGYSLAWVFISGISAAAIGLCAINLIKSPSKGTQS